MKPQHGIHEKLAGLATPIGEVYLNPANTNRHPEEQIAVLMSMLREFGQRSPLIVRASNGQLEAGEGRLLAMKRLGWTHVAVIECDDDAITAARFSIGDNQSGRLSYDDEEALALELKVLIDEGQDVEGLGFDEDAIKDLVAMLDDPESVVEVEVEDVVLDNGPPPFCAPGDLVVIGDHILVIGDSTDPEVVARVMGEGQLADMVFTDPPYGVDYTGGAKGVADREKIENDNLGDEGTLELVRDAAAAWPLKPGGAFYVCCASMTETSFRLGLRAAGRRLRQSIVWVKSSLCLGRSDYQWQHEPILYGWADGASHFWCGSRTETTVWDFRKPKKSPEHPTTKPVELVAKAIANSSRPGDIVFDGFGGSGSTMRAAHQLGRRSRLIELKPQYGDAICRSMVVLGERPIVYRGAASFDWSDPRRGLE